MAKVIVSWCDPCMVNDEHTPGNPFVVTLGATAKPKEIDLCETHEKELIAPLRELLGEVGQPVGSEQLALDVDPDKTKKQCPQCSEERLLTREGLRGHLRKLHGVERSAANDVVRDIFGNARIQKPFSEQCPECKEAGVPVAESTYDTPQGMGAHRKAVHGVDGTKSH
jgi:hypothetical protein